MPIAIKLPWNYHKSHHRNGIQWTPLCLPLIINFLNCTISFLQNWKKMKNRKNYYFSYILDKYTKIGYKILCYNDNFVTSCFPWKYHLALLLFTFFFKRKCFSNYLYCFLLISLLNLWGFVFNFLKYYTIYVCTIFLGNILRLVVQRAWVSFCKQVVIKIRI